MDTGSPNISKSSSVTVAVVWMENSDVSVYKLEVSLDVYLEIKDAHGTFFKSNEIGATTKLLSELKNSGFTEFYGPSVENKEPVTLSNVKMIVSGIL